MAATAHAPPAPEDDLTADVGVAGGGSREAHPQTSGTNARKREPCADRDAIAPQSSSKTSTMSSCMISYKCVIAFGASCVLVDASPDRTPVRTTTPFWRSISSDRSLYVLVVVMLPLGSTSPGLGSHSGVIQWPVNGSRTGFGNRDTLCDALTLSGREKREACTRQFCDFVPALQCDRGVAGELHQNVVDDGRRAGNRSIVEAGDLDVATDFWHGAARELRRLLSTLSIQNDTGPLVAEVVGDRDGQEEKPLVPQLGTCEARNRRAERDAVRRARCHEHCGEDEGEQGSGCGRFDDPTSRQRQLTSTLRS
jgi:hypothetical protein